MNTCVYLNHMLLKHNINYFLHMFSLENGLNYFYCALKHNGFVGSEKSAENRNRYFDTTLKTPRIPAIKLPTLGGVTF